jgi:hypothetical protein
MSYPVFASGDVLNASDMNAVGLWKITSTTATSGTALNIDSIFSADYDCYRLVVSDVRITTGVTGMAAQLRVGGSPANTNYYNVRQGFDYSTGAASPAATSNGASWNLALIVDSSNSAACVIDIYHPFLTQKTGYSAQGVDSRTTGLGAFSSSGFHNSATSYTGISIFSASTFTNIDVSVYGYRL